MEIYIVIPAYNEADFIGETLRSLVEQTIPPKKIVVVDDGSTDATPQIVSEYAAKYSFITLIHSASKTGTHAPGSKVVTAFNEGFKTLDDHFDIICKFDADLIFPPNYLEALANIFSLNSNVGIAGGFCIIENRGKWEIENLTSRDHLRGALKAYRKECFYQIGRLKPAMGWDTVDELLAQYHNWTIQTDDRLLVKHLKPTGGSYTRDSKFKQGEAFYRLGYDLKITIIASAKLAFRKGNFTYFTDYLRGYFRAKKEKQPLLVTPKEARYIRKLRWQKMRRKLYR